MFEGGGGEGGVFLGLRFVSCDVIICLGEFSERLRNGQSIEPMRCGLSSPDGVSLALSASV